MESSWLFINIDEIFYRFHIYIADPVLGFVTLEWWRETGAGRAIEEGQLGVVSDTGFFDRFFSSGFFRIFSSRPSAEHDSIQEYLDPSDQKSIWELVIDFMFGTGDKESVFAIIFGSFVGWVLIGGVLGYFLMRYLAGQISYMQKRRELLYDLKHSGHVQKQANDKASRWQKITQQLANEDGASWKIAVMDADILLDEVLSEQGFSGEDVGSKLADARSNGDLDTISYASQAHAIRNKIAHDGNFELSQREAKTAISMYERFFNELYHI